ncbi:MAG: hypothetical protein JW699_05180 [Chitinispirillaceae bacterium]|nr:hypothetical protein [Chitinispirillaceae bacterium]
MIRTAKTVTLFLFLFALMTFPQLSQAQPVNPENALSQYIADLQKTPNDYILREKIIRHVQGMSPRPAVPEEAKKYIARGRAAVKDAKEAKDFNEAAEEFKKALLAAPWLAEGYFNMGIVQDKAEQYAAAMESLKLYVVAAPDAPDGEKVKELIYEIEYRQEKSQKEAGKKTVEQKTKERFESLSGKWNGHFLNTGLYNRPTISSDWLSYSTIIEVSVTDNNFEAISRNTNGNPQYVYKGAINGSTISGVFSDFTTLVKTSCGISAPPSVLEGEVSPDGNSILLVVRGAQLLKGGDCKYDSERYSKSVKLVR